MSNSSLLRLAKSTFALRPKIPVFSHRFVRIEIRCRSQAMAPKRKATSPVRPMPLKKQQLDDSVDRSRAAEEAGIIQREFYPAEMSNERCARYNKNEIPRPVKVLSNTLADTLKARSKIPTGECVVHWFKRDLRTRDNTALSLASRKARGANVPLVCMYLLSPQDFQAHCTSAARVDFDLRTLGVIQKDLMERDIPLYVASVDKRRDVAGLVLAKCREWGAKHLFCNIEYEVDELRREAKLVQMCLDEEISFTAVDDDCVVPPGNLMSGSGNQYSVYTPWYKAWVKHLHEHPKLLDDAGTVASNPASAREKVQSLFSQLIPEAPHNKQLSDGDRARLASLWPAGEHEAHDRLSRFIDQKVKGYKDTRNSPSLNNTSLLSVHFAAGTLSVRTAIRAAQASNSSQKLDAGSPGIITWISEVAWRDFYKHVLAHWPYVCMGKAFKYEYSNIEWEYSDEQFERWTRGLTGFPIVDAAMRQVRGMSWMHNRCRMIVASFLAKDLLLDWRRGEKWFMEHLIDGDFASNNGGWGFAASTGVDPQPYFRIFNPLLQSERFDPDGEYIRKWVPELADIKGKAVHDPYGRGAAVQAQKSNYPRPMVDHKLCRERALDRYKRGLGRPTANEGGGVHN